MLPIRIRIFSKGRCGMQKLETPTSKSRDMNAISDACLGPVRVKSYKLTLSFDTKYRVKLTRQFIKIYLVISLVNH